MVMWKSSSIGLCSPRGPWRMLALVATAVVLVTIAWVFIAPDVDLLDSTCSQTLLDQAPSPTMLVAVTSAVTRPLAEHSMFVRASGAEPDTGPGLLTFACTRLC